MAIKHIKFQELMPLWVTREMDLECPKGETDEQTFARIRKEGTSLTGAKEFTPFKFQEPPYEALPDKKLGGNQTLDFGDQPLRYRPELGVITNQPGNGLKLADK